MDREGVVSMDAGQDVWDWEEVLPDDHMSSSSCVGHDSSNLLAGKSHRLSVRDLRNFVKMICIYDGYVGVNCI